MNYTTIKISVDHHQEVFDYMDHQSSLYGIDLDWFVCDYWDHEFYVLYIKDSQLAMLVKLLFGGQ